MLRVAATEKNSVIAEVVRGGEVEGGMGVNLPDVETSLPSLTPHDQSCIGAALEAGVDALSLSFVRRAEDVTELRRRMVGLGRVVPIIAKLEKAQAVAPILALTPHLDVARVLTVVWSVEPRLASVQPDDHEEVVRLAERSALQYALATAGDPIVVTHGVPLVAQPLTNLMRVHRVCR